MTGTERVQVIVVNKSAIVAKLGYHQLEKRTAVLPLRTLLKRSVLTAVSVTVNMQSFHAHVLKENKTMRSVAPNMTATHQTLVPVPSLQRKTALGK